METMAFHPERLIAYLICLLLFLISISKSQELTIQISPDSTTLNQFPSIHLDESGKVWIAYVSNDSTLVVGYYSQNSWYTVFSLPPQGGIAPNSFVEAAIDEMQRVWFIYTDATATTRVAYTNGITWNVVPTSLPVLRISRNYPNGVWFCCSSDSTVYAYHAVGQSILQTKTISTPPPDAGNAWPIQSIPQQHIAGLRPDRIVSLYGFLGERINMYYSYTNYSMFRYSESIPPIILKENGGSNNGGPSGSRNYSIAFGTDGKACLAVTQICSWNYQDYSYAINLLDSTNLHFWYGILPSNSPSFNSSPQISVSNNSHIMATVWFLNDTLQVKMYASPYWYLTKTYTETVGVIAGRAPRVVVDSDSSVWVAYSAMKENRRHVFLSRIHPSFTIDGILSAVQSQDMNRTLTTFRLHQNYPNPFNPNTTIMFDISGQALVTLKVFDVLGREVSTLVNEEMKMGSYARVLHGDNLASGVYLYRLQAGTFTETKKLLLLR